MNELAAIIGMKTVKDEGKLRHMVASTRFEI